MVLSLNDLYERWRHERTLWQAGLCAIALEQAAAEYGDSLFQCPRPIGAPFPKFVSRCAASVVGTSKSPALAAFAKVVIDRLRNQVANSTVFLGAQLLNERQFVREKKDRRADQVQAGNFFPLTASRRMSCDRRFAQHDFVPRVDTVGIDLNQANLRTRPEATQVGLRQDARSACRLG